MSLTAEDGRKAAREDRAIGASYDYPDESLGVDYCQAYANEWRNLDLADQQRIAEHIDAEQRDAVCPTCANGGGQHELWCPEAPATLTMGELREYLTKAIELDEVNETKRVGLLYRTGRSDGSTEQRLAPLRFMGVHFVRGEFVFALERAEQ